MNKIWPHQHDKYPRKWVNIDTNYLLNDPSGVLNAEVFKIRARRGNMRFVDEGEGNLISSMVELGVHRPVLDLDFAHQYVPSSTPGHAHLYIDHLLMDDTEYYGLLSTLNTFGLLGKGNVEQFKAHSMTLVRAPGVKK